MFIETVPNRDSPPAVLLRESYRDEQGRSQKRTLANLSKLPRDMIDTLKAVLKGGTVVGTGPQELEVERSLPHGHVAAALGMVRKIGLDRLILSAAKDSNFRIGTPTGWLRCRRSQNPRGLGSSRRHRCDTAYGNANQARNLLRASGCCPNSSQ